MHSDQIEGDSRRPQPPILEFDFNESMSYDPKNALDGRHSAFSGKPLVIEDEPKKFANHLDEDGNRHHQSAAYLGCEPAILEPEHKLDDVEKQYEREVALQKSKDEHNISQASFIQEHISFIKQNQSHIEMETGFIAKDEQHSFGDELLLNSVMSPRVFEDKEMRSLGVSESIKVQQSNIEQNGNPIDLSPLRNELQHEKISGNVNLFSLNYSSLSNFAQYASDQEDVSLNSSMAALGKIKSFEKQNYFGNSTISDAEKSKHYQGHSSSDQQSLFIDVAPYSLHYNVNENRARQSNSFLNAYDKVKKLSFEEQEQDSLEQALNLRIKTMHPHQKQSDARISTHDITGHKLGSQFSH